MMLERYGFMKCLLTALLLISVSSIAAQGLKDGKPKVVGGVQRGKSKGKTIQHKDPNKVTLNGKVYDFTPDVISWEGLYEYGAPALELTFAYGSSTLDGLHKQVLDTLSRDYSYRLIVFAYVDINVNPDVTLRLGERRGTEVANYMRQKGYVVGEITVKGTRLADQLHPNQMVVVRDRNLLADASERMKAQLAARAGNESSSQGASVFSSSGTYRSVVPTPASNFQAIREMLEVFECKGGDLAESGKGVVFTADGSFFTTEGEPFDDEFVSFTHSDRFQNTAIKDFSITKSGHFVLIYGRNGNYRRGCPSAMAQVLREKNSQKKSIFSVAMNDQGEWAVVHDDGFSADSETVKFLRKAKEKYGRIVSVSIAEQGKVACCEDGVYYEDIPQNLRDQIRSLSFKPRVVRFTSNGFFLITDGESKSVYFI